MPGRPKTRAKREAANDPRNPKFQYLSDIYAEQYDTFDALRMAMVQNGIVDHGINPYDVIQRAIDDTTVDYLLLRRRIDHDTHGDPVKLVNHQLYPYMEHIRENMVRYSTFAMQYDIQRKQLKLSETRVALLADTLRTVLTSLGLTDEQVRQVPKLIIANLKNDEPKGSRIGNPRGLDPNKAEAIAEILHHDAEVTIADADVIEDTEPPTNGNGHGPAS